MTIEIERKFLVTDDSWRKGADAGTRYRQGYLCASGRCSVRVRLADDRAILGIKALAGDDCDLSVRHEYEYEIDRDDAEHMLAQLCSDDVIEKVRFLVGHAGLVWEIDVFEGANAPLVVAEVELSSPDKQVSLPSWIGAEVTQDERYLNVSLARHPYASWPR